MIRDLSLIILRTMSERTDPWNCPELCGVEYGYWCHHLAPEARCQAVNERGQQCTGCAGHNTDATWPGFAAGRHSYNREA